MQMMYQSAGGIQQEYAALATADPLIAIGRLPEFLERARDINPPGIEALAGGPNQDWTVPMLNIVGTLYPSLSREQRQQALGFCLSYLDKIEFHSSQRHVAMIDEPWLVGDIVITRPRYWCGFDWYCQWLDQDKDWSSFRSRIPQASSIFWLTMAMVWNGPASFPIRQQYYRHYPDLVDRTLDVIAGDIACHGLQDVNKGAQLDLFFPNSEEEAIQQVLVQYDSQFSERIREKMQRQNWIKLDQRY